MLLRFAMPLGDTIVALSTPPGTAALALIRASGPLCAQLAAECFGRKSPPPPRQATFGTLRDKSGEKLDEVIYIYYAQPHSFTGEDMLEIACHGNPFIVQNILKSLCERGCRMAEPGEFTRTAYLNEKLDLSQAESVADVIHARSEVAVRAAQRQLGGGLSERTNPLKGNLLQLCAHLEAYIDFPEEDLPPEDQEGPLRSLAQLEEQMRELAATSRFRAALHEGVRTVILGAPNAGKSSLLNRLAGSDRVIVAEKPGTTRDTVEECLNIGAFTLRVIDTAGLHTTEDAIERLGIERTVAAAQQGDFFLIVVDSTAPCPTLPEAVLSHLNPDNSIVVANKADLPESNPAADFLQNMPHVSLSAKTGNGVNVLRGTIQACLQRHFPVDAGAGLIVNERHAAALNAAAHELNEARKLLLASEPPELAATHVHEAIAAIGTITGRIDNEEMLDHLFSTFCIGK